MLAAEFWPVYWWNEFTLRRGAQIAKVERHTVAGEPVDVVVHRKGATRSFPAGHPDIPSQYAGVGQPVLIPGDMG